MAALVDVEHLAAILCLADVQHLTRADGTPSVRIILITQGFHLQHVLTTDGLVAAFIENDARIVTIVNNGIAHQLDTLFPLAALAVFLRIAGRHGLHQAHAVARLDVLLPGRDVHPAHQIGVAFHHQAVTIVAQPSRNAHAHARPFVAGALGKTFHLNDAIIQPDHSFTEAGLAETCPCTDFVHFLAIHPEAGLHHVQIAVAPAPEVETVYLGRRLQDGLLAGLHDDGSTLERLQQAAVAVDQLRTVAHFLRPTILVPHLRLGMDDCLARLHADVFGIDINTGGLQVAIER